MPAIIADLGEQAGWRYVEFFTANIRNPHTRRAYARACGQFFAWCDQRGLTLTAIRPHDVATYIEQLLAIEASAPLVKHQLAAVRMLFDWLVVGQIVPANPASAVRGPKHVVKTGSTPVLEGDEWRKLLDSIPTTTLRDLRDRDAGLAPDKLQHLVGTRVAAAATAPGASPPAAGGGRGAGAGGAPSSRTAGLR